MPTMNKSWRDWVKTNLQRNCDMEDILSILLKNKFPLHEIKREMGERFPSYSLLLGERAAPDHAAIASIPLTTRGESQGLRRIETPKLQIFTVESFLGAEDCDHLVNVMNANLRPSTVVGDRNDPYYRTSSTCDLSWLKEPRIDAIDKKIVEFVGIHRSYTEGIEAQKYAVGQEFRPHTDFFNPGVSGQEERIRRQGNRTWTFMVYLNDTPKGGGTRFPNADITFYPKKGNAVAWNNLHPDGKPNRDTLHWGMPVEEGEKFVITKWFREYGNGPMMLPQLG